MFSGIFAFAIWVAVAVLAIRLVNAAAMRELKANGRRLRRDVEPGDYWFEMAGAAAVLLFMAACLVLPPIPGGGGRPTQPLAVLYAPFLLLTVARAFRHGRTGLFGREVRRSEKPREFWTIVIVEAALALGLLAAIGYGFAAPQPRA